MSERRRKLRRQMHVESLERRQLMAVGPQLIGIQPNLGDLLRAASLGDGRYDLDDVGRISVLNEAPNALRLSFDESQQFATTGVQGIQVVRAGLDGLLGTGDDQTVLRSDGAGFNGFVGGDAAPNRNVVVLRFPETLPDDLYRVEIFGVDLPGQSIVGLRNTAGDLFTPAGAGEDSQKIDFKLSLGARVTAVVPQPVERGAGGVLQQRLNRIDLYFNEDPLFPTDVATGDRSPDPSVVRPEFYQLIMTQGTVRNTDDVVFNPTSVAYDRDTNSARLTFASNLHQLIDPATMQPIGYGTFRLRVGTNELTPTNPAPETPTRSTPAAAASSDFGTSGGVRVDFTATDDFAEAVKLSFSTAALGALAPPLVQVAGGRIHVTLNSDAGTTAAQLVTAINGNAAASALVTASIDFVTGGNPATVLGVVGAVYAPVTLTGMGSSFATAADLGQISLAGSQNQIISAAISEARSFALDFPGTKDEPGHRELPDQAGQGYDQHILESFGYDSYAGPRTIAYNFKAAYGIDPQGNALGNVITDTQRERVREAFELWSNYLGVQFVETASDGVTIATGSTSVLNTAAPDVRSGASTVVRVDPNYVGSMIVMDRAAAWNDTFGQNYFQQAMQSIGWVLGLGNSPELPASNEPVFPNPQDVIHGRLLHRTDGTDVDLYRFTVDLADGKAGAFTAQVFAERQTDSSLLDSVLRLYRETDAAAATVSSDFNTGELVRVRFTAAEAGRRGNDLSIAVTQSSALGANPQIVVVGDVINVILGVGTTANHLLAALAADGDAAALITAQIESGDGATDLSTVNVNYSPLGLAGGADRTRALIATNDDYFSKDSLIRMNLERGTYYIGVSAKGNEAYDPSIEATGLGGRTAGTYQLQLNFRPQVDFDDAIRDQDRANEGQPGTPLDGDGDGTPGGVYDFWFQTQNLQRVLEITGGGSAFADGQIVTVTNFNGAVRRFEFNSIGGVGSGNIPIAFNAGSTASGLAAALAAAMNGPTGFNTPGFATASGSRITLAGDRMVTLSSGISAVRVHGKTIFVDKNAPTAADGSLNRPFNNIAGSVTNAFAATYPTDIVRIVGNGGTDGNPDTASDTFAYEIGYGALPGQVLTDGTTMEVPRGVTVMIDAGAVFKLSAARIGVGSTTEGVDRSQAALQVLGTPLRNVYFTSWLDESIGRDTTTSRTTPGTGNWGGISFKNDIDHRKGRFDYEAQGVFLNYVNNADIRYGGGIVSIDSNGQVVPSIQMIEARPTITFNTIRNAANSAMSADPDSFAETDFSAPQYQRSGAFTPDYDRVGPEVHGNRLIDNSINGLFVRIATPLGDATRVLTKAGRFDDTDIVHYLAENLEIQGTPGGPLRETTGPAFDLVSVTTRTAGGLAAGAYSYRMTFVDSDGNESPASAATTPANLAATGALRLANLPQASGTNVARRLYRSVGGGSFKLIAELNASDTTFIDDDSNRTYLNLSSPTAGAIDPALLGPLNRPRLDASLVIDPGTVVKLEGARFEATFGAQFTAEGLLGSEVIFTSNSDDRYGAGGTFDTNNDNPVTPTAVEGAPAAGNWGGIYLGHTSSASIDRALLAFGGGVNKIEGTFTGFNVLEVHQAELRLAHSALENNASGVGGQAGPDRLGRMTNVPATLFVRGAQPIVLDNVIRNNASAAIQIDLNSLHGFIQGDAGRQTGAIDRVADYDQNRGPLVRDNRLSNNARNGLVVRGGTLAVEGIWDDTDVVHVLAGPVTIPNFHTFGGLRLESSPTESLVVKSEGGGITAGGARLDIVDRIGGMLHVIGQPGYPVVLTSIFDDTVGAGLQPDQTPMFNTDNSASPTIGAAGAWTGLTLDQYSHDRNVEIVMETELADATAPGTNATPDVAQTLGELAPSLQGGDDALRLGYVVNGYLNDVRDVDVYSFIASAGTEIWLDVDRTELALDSVIELLNADGDVLARSDNSRAEAADPSLLYVNDAEQIERHQVNPLSTLTGGRDFWTLNERDPGMRVVLPGTPGARSTFFFRIRSAGEDLELLDDGLTAGVYEVQLRMVETDEKPGSTIRYADIRYATNAVRTIGLPAHSPLTGEIGEDEVTGGPDNNGVFVEDQDNPGTRPQLIGNILASDRAVLSIAGEISNPVDLDVYRLQNSYTAISSQFNPPLTVPTVFDLDYADGLIRPDTTVSVFDGAGRLILIGRDSNILDDRPRPLSGTDTGDLARGSIGTFDPFIGPVALPTGQEYFTVVTHAGRMPAELLTNPLVRLEPINSVQRIAEDRIGSSGGSTAFPPVVPQLLDPSFVGAGANLWHVTNRRANDAGHGITEAFDGSRVAGAGVVTEQEPNNSLAGAANIDAAQWSTVFDFDVGDDTVNTSTTIPHVRINGTGDGTFDYYRFTVSAAGTLGIFDIDGGATGQPGTIDTMLFLYDSAGNLLASNDNAFIANGAGGSTSPLDAYLQFVFAAPGQYVLGVAEAGSVGAFGGITGNPPDSGDQYTLHISVENHPLPPINIGGGQSFYFGREIFGDYNIGARAVGSLTSNPFDLGGYSAADLPMLYFNYFLDTDGVTDTFRVYLRDAGGAETLLASTVASELLTGDVVGIVGNSGGWRQARVPLDPGAGLNGLRLRFEFDSVNALFNTGEGAYLDDVIIGFAERGEMVTNAGPNTAFTASPDGASTNVASGAYQLEIRRGETFATAQNANPNSLKLDQVFDTNDRLSGQLTVAFPSGAALVDGQTFVVGDGLNELRFEFDTGGGVGDDNVPVPFLPGSTASQIAAAFRDTMNGPSVQGVLKLQATSANGAAAGTANDGRVALHGRAVIKLETSPLVVAQDALTGDMNVPREQGQVLIHSNVITDPLEFGVWTDAGLRDSDGRGIPWLGTSYPGPARNLAAQNDTPVGGLTPGVVVENNVISGDMIAGVQVSGDSPIWEIVTRRPQAYPLQQVENQTAGDAVCDGDAFTITSNRLSVTFEWEDIAGSPTDSPDRLCRFGSGVNGGNGWNPIRIPIFYRRSVPTVPGFTQAQMAQAMATAINGSVLVNNGTSLAAETFVANNTAGGQGSRLFGGISGPDPAVYVNHAIRVFPEPLSPPRGPGYRVARVTPVARGPQPFARVTNNTIFGNDGSYSFSPEANVDTAVSPNDTLDQAIDTRQGRQNNPVAYTTAAAIGDGPFFRTDRTVDVDFYQFQAIAGDRVLIDVDAIGGLDALLRLFDEKGEEIRFSDNAAAPGETVGVDPFIDFFPTVSGTYYVAVSGRGNRDYDPLSLGRRGANASSGAYNLSIAVRSPNDWYVDVRPIFAGATTFTIRDRFNSATVSVGGVGMPPGPPQFAINLANAINTTVANSGLIGISARVVGQVFVIIDGAVDVEGLPGQTPGGGANQHHVVQQQGLLITEHASPTLLNNVFVNHQNGVFQTNFALPLFPATQFTAIEAASVYQHNGANSNITSSGSDFNAAIAANVQLFVNAAGGNFYPAPNSPLIDSAVDTLQDRAVFLDEIKKPMSLPASPILAPSRDVFGQLRIDDPTYDSPLAQGPDVFKDRGALDRADFVDPRAVLVDPQDNDALGVDADPTETYVQLTAGSYSQFTILIRDGQTADNPFPGAAVLDSTLETAPVLIVEDELDLTLVGPAVTVFQDGRLLLEGFDYRYRYDSIGNTVQIVSLAGVWPNDSVFEIKLNNRDRFVIDAPRGDAVADGDIFTVTDDTGARITFEYESGYRMIVGPTLAIQVPQAGTGANGISDGQKFTIDDGKNSATFEFDNNGPTSAGSRVVPFTAGMTLDQLAQAIVDAISLAVTNGALVGLQPKVLEDGLVHVGATPGTSVSVSSSNLTTNILQYPTGLIIPAAGVGPGGLVEGETFTITNGVISRTFEFDSDSIVTGTNIPVTLPANAPVDVIADTIALQINSTPLGLAAANVGGGVVRFTTPNANHTVDVTQTALLRTMFVGGVADGETFTIQRTGDTPIVFEFDKNGVFVDADADLAPDNVLIAVTPDLTHEQIAALIVSTVAAQAPYLSPLHFGDGNIQLDDATDGTPFQDYVLDAAAAPSLAVSGAPGVRPATTLQLPVSVALEVPATGGAAITDGELFTVTNAGRTVVFEFDSDSVFEDVDGDLIPDNQIVPFTIGDTQASLASILGTAIGGAGLSLNPLYLGAGILSLGGGTTATVDLNYLGGGSSLGQNIYLRGLVDGDRFTIDDGVRSQTFEYENSLLGNGVGVGRTPIFFTPRDLADAVANATAAVLVTSNLCTYDDATCLDGATNLGGGRVLLGDSGRHITTLVAGSALVEIGVPAGAVTIPFQPDASFSDSRMARFMIAAINQAEDDEKLTETSSSSRGGSTLFVDFQSDAGDDVDFTRSPASIVGVNNFYLRAVQDQAGNDLRSNRASGQTQFTILMPGVTLDYGDIPDPFSGPGRYPTQNASDGARHTVGYDVNGALRSPILGRIVDREFDAPAGATAQGDDVDLMIDLTSSPGLSLSGSPGALEILIGDAGGGTPNVSDGATFTIFDGSQSATIEFDSNLAVTDGRTIVQFQPTDSIDALAVRIVDAVRRTGLSVAATNLGGGRISIVTDDEDGVEFGGLFNEYLDTPVNVFVTAPVGWEDPIYLDAWIDYNQDGDWDDPLEQIFRNRVLQPGNNSLVVRTAPGATPGATFARFRLSQTGDLLPTGVAVGGEVEDYRIEVIPGVPPVAVDDPLLANAGAYATTEDAPIAVSAAAGLLANDSDVDTAMGLVTVSEVDGATGVIGVTTAVTSGANVIVQADGSFNYDPTTSPTFNSLAQGATGVDTFTYRLTDGVLPSNLATVTITLTGVNDSPAAADDQYALTEDQLLVGVNLMTDDTGAGVDTDADTGAFPGTVDTLRLISIGGTVLSGTSDVQVTLPSGSVVTAIYNVATSRFDGAFRFDPSGAAALQALVSGGPTGQDVFTYQIADSLNASSTGTVTMTVSGANDAPIANPNAYTTDEDTTLTGVNLITDNTGAGADVDPDAGETATLVLTAINGTAVTFGSPITLLSGASLTPINASGAFSYNPANAFQTLPQGQNGTDTFTYTIRDVNGATSVGTATITVAGVNDSPTARPNSYNTDENTVLSGRNMIVNNTGLGVDSDPDVGDVLSVAAINGTGVAGAANVVRVLPSGATLTLLYNSSLGRFDGAFTYDASTSTTLNALNVGQTASDTFTYTIADLQAGTSTSTVTITVAGVNDAPTATGNLYVTTEDSAITTANVITDAPADSDPDTGDTALLNVIAVNGVSGNVGQTITTARGASLRILANGATNYNPTGSAALQALRVGEQLNDTFTYTVSDNRGGTSTATVTVTVTGANDNPIARPNSYSTDDNTALAGRNVITDATADSDPDAGETALLVVSAVGGSPAGVGTSVLSAKGASVTIDANGSLIYDPTVSAVLNALTVGQSDTDTFTYTIRDPSNATSTATVTVTVVGVNDAPTARNNSYTVGENATLTGVNIITDAPADTDPDAGDTLRISALNGVTANVGTALTTTLGATLQVTTSGVLAYNPGTSATLNALTTGQTATETFVYTLSDNRNATSTATVTITVQGVNDVPTVVNDTVVVNQDTTIDIAVLANDSDPEGPLTTSTVTIVSGSGPTNGTASVNANRTIRYIPTAGFTGSDSFRYTVTDNHGGVSAQATVSITVRPTPSPFQNPDNNLDVNDDGFVAPNDALLVINFLNINPPNSTPPAPTPYLDVDGDRFVAPSDAAPIITFLNLPGNSEGEGEGEAFGGVVDAELFESLVFTATAAPSAIGPVGLGADVVADHRWAVQEVGTIATVVAVDPVEAADWALADELDGDGELWEADWVEANDGADEEEAEQSVDAVWADWGDL